MPLYGVTACRCSMVATARRLPGHSGAPGKLQWYVATAYDTVDRMVRACADTMSAVARRIPVVQGLGARVSCEMRDMHKRDTLWSFPPFTVLSRWSALHRRTPC
jgi:hypothetical protein